MNAQSRIPQIRGVWSWLESLITSRGLVLTMALLLLVCAITATTLGPGHNPADGLWVRLPLAVLPFSVLGIALWSSQVHRWTASLVAVGVWAVLVGSWQPQRTGVLTVGSKAVESYRRDVSDRSVAVHLGTQVTEEKQEQGVGLFFGMPTAEKRVLEFKTGEVGEKNFDGRTYARLGEARSSDNQLAVLSVKSRAKGGREQVIKLPTGKPFVTQDGLRLNVTQLRNDFIYRLGAAAEVDVQWDGGGETSWYFADAPDLDERYGESPWIVQLLRIEGDIVGRYTVRRRGVEVLAWTGWGLILAGLFGRLATRLRRREGV